MQRVGTLMTSAVFQSIGVTELLIVLGVVLLIFGPKRLPMLGRQLGDADGLEDRGSHEGPHPLHGCWSQAGYPARLLRRVR
jgi:TatA/E family protein of Tat protein translocase